MLMPFNSDIYKFMEIPLTDLIPQIRIHYKIILPEHRFPLFLKGI